MTLMRLTLLGSALLSLFLLFPSGVLAQTWEDPMDDPKEDPGSTEDPWTDDSESTLGLDVEPFTGDPIYLDDPADYSAGEIGKDPSYGYSAAEGPVKCTSYAGEMVKPVRLSGDSPRYLSYALTPRILIGASPDAACHFVPTTAEALKDKCQTALTNPAANPKDFRTVLPALKAAGLNKIRLWVALGHAKDAVNSPFLQENGFYVLSKKNQTYFDRLVAVVSKAKELDMFVEVTFFAPFEGSLVLRQRLLGDRKRTGKPEGQPDLRDPLAEGHDHRGRRKGPAPAAQVAPPDRRAAVYEEGRRQSHRRFTGVHPQRALHADSDG